MLYVYNKCMHIGAWYCRFHAKWWWGWGWSLQKAERIWPLTLWPLTPGLDLECLQSWGQFFLLGVFGLLMICIEWWSFEVGIILAGKSEAINTFWGHHAIELIILIQLRLTCYLLTVTYYLYTSMLRNEVTASRVELKLLTIYQFLRLHWPCPGKVYLNSWRSLSSWGYIDHVRGRFT